jgi:hypothetical protein
MPSIRKTQRQPAHDLIVRIPAPSKLVRPPAKTLPKKKKEILRLVSSRVYQVDR